MKALVVEDDLKSQCLLAKVLAERTHEVATFENAEQAILECQKELYPLIFVDVGLPGMGGLQFCRWIRTQPLGENPYIIAALDPDAPDKVQQVLEAGANDFLTKPYHLEQLRARLVIGERHMAQALEQQRLAQELRNENDRWTATEEALVRAQQECAAIVNANEEEVIRLREELKTLSSALEAKPTNPSQDSAKEEDLECLRDELQTLGKRCEALETALNEAKHECDLSKERLREAEQALESAQSEVSKLKFEDHESVESIQELLRTRELELQRLQTELMSAQAEVATRSQREVEQMAKWSDQMRASLEDRRVLERELATAHDELVRRGREQVDESLRRADEFHELLEERRRLQRELECRTNQLEQEHKQLVLDREQSDRKLSMEMAEADRLRAGLSGAEEQLRAREQDHAAVLEELRLHQDAHKSSELRWQALARLSVELNKAQTAEKVAEIAAQTTYELMGWDGYSADAYMIEGNWVHPLLTLERRDGESRIVQPWCLGPQPSSLMRRVLEDGTQMITRPIAADQGTRVMLVDQRIQRSTSLICSPIETGERVIGFLSLRSGACRSYSTRDLILLEMVAAQCAAALERVELKSAGAGHGIAMANLSTEMAPAEA